MFGLIISGRPVDATPQEVAANQYAFRLPPTPAFNHIVVFLLPGTQLPPGTAASVFVQIPPSGEFKFLGAIGAGKESAIFKISGLKSDPNGNGGMMTDASGSTINGEIVVGVSLEPEAEVEQRLVTLKSQGSMALVPAHATASGGPVATKVLAQRIIGNAFNFLASFGSDVIPLKAFESWWQKFEKRIELDPSFLERAEQG